MIDNYKITLGMPVLNGEEHIHYALDSIFQQSFKNFNMIIYDNASTDKTLSICEKYKKKYNKIKIYKQKKRVSSIHNWMSILKKTNSKYFLFCAHDDFYKGKKYLTNLVNKISKNTIPFGSVQIIDNKNNFIKHLTNDRIYNYQGYRIYKRLKFFFTPSIFGKNNIIYGIHERQHILNIFKSFKKKYENIIHPDNYINYEVLKIKKVIPVKKVILYKRIRKQEENVTLLGSKRNKLSSLLYQLRMLLNYIRFSNIFEIIAIILLTPIYILNERIFVLIFKIINK